MISTRTLILCLGLIIFAIITTLYVSFRHSEYIFLYILLGAALALLIFLIKKISSDNVKQKKSEQKFKALLDAAPDATVIANEKGIIEMINHQAEQLFGYSREEMIGGPVEILLPQELKDKHVHHRGNFFKAAKLRSMGAGLELNAVKKDGTTFPVEISLSPMQTEEGVLISASIRDVTERKKLENQLKKTNDEVKTLQKKKSERIIKDNEEITSLIMNSALDAIICIDTRGGITVWNSQAEKMFGWKEQEILGKRLDETIIPEIYRHGHRTGFDHYMKTGEGPLLGKLIEISALNRSGNEFPIELAIVPIKQNGREFFCAFIRDITQRKQAEEELFRKRNLFRAVIDNLPDYIYAKDTKLHYIMGNQAIVELVGAALEEEIIGKNSLELFGREVARVNFDEDSKVIELGTQVINREEPITSYSGDKLCLLTTKVPLRDKDGNITGLIGISRDITERKESELQLRESEEKYRTLFEGNLAGVFQTNIEGKILNCNDAFAKMLGYLSHREMEQKNAGILYFSRNDRDSYISLLSKKGQLTNHELILKHTDGRRIFGLINITLRKDSLTNEQIIEGVMLDITERKKAEEELRQINEELRELSSHLQNVREEERIQIARDIHDDLGQQLTGLKMDVAWLNKKMETEDEIVKQKMNNMVELIDETVKTVRRISSNLRPSILDDLGLIAALEWQSGEVEKRSEIKVNFSGDMTEPDIPLSVATGIFRIYQELLTNAVRHANAHIITSSLKLKDDQLVLKIKDDGQGMDPAITGSKKTLGLVGIKERTFVLGGKYDLKSEPGKGTEIQVSVPI
jgi:PAS domain S-box-containing protein